MRAFNFVSRSLFAKRVLIISTDNSTRFFTFSVRLQVVVITIFTITSVSLIYHYLKITRSNFVHNIIQDNEHLKKENLELLNSTSKIANQLDDINRYMESVQSIDKGKVKKISVTTAKSSLTSKDAIQIITTLDDKIAQTYSLLNNRMHSLSKMLNGEDGHNVYNQKLSNVALGGPYSHKNKIASSALSAINVRLPNSLNGYNITNEISNLITLEQLVADLPTGIPVSTSNYVITSHYSVRMDPFLRIPAMHSGLDVQHSQVNGNIVSTGYGTVIFAGRKGGYGNCVDIMHTNRNVSDKVSVVTRYGHLSSISVKKGDNVSPGFVLGKQGNTGRSRGNHVHYEMRINNIPINPIYFVQKKYKYYV